MHKALIVGIVMAASFAYAEPPKYTRKQPVTVPVTLSERVKPIQPVKQAPTKPVSADAVLIIKERQQPLRKEQEAILEKLIKDTPDDDPDKPDYMFRLAEQYAQQLQFYRLKSMEAVLGK
jgi:hypothetical protein